MFDNEIVYCNRHKLEHVVTHLPNGNIDVGCGFFVANSRGPGYCNFVISDCLSVNTNPEKFECPLSRKKESDKR